MSKIFLAAAVSILSHFLLSVDCVSSAEMETMHREIIARVEQRRATSAAAPEDLEKIGRPRKLSAEQAQLINDVTLIFGDSMTVSQKFEHFKLLMTQLGIPGEPVSINRFHEISAIINRNQSPVGKCSNRGRTPKIGAPVSDKLTQMLSEKASLTCQEAFEALEKNAVVPLPSMTDIQEWLKYRRKVSGFLKLLEQPCVDRSKFLLEGEGVNESETCKMLVRNASIRRGRTFLKGSSGMYTSEHDALVMDVVKTFNREVSLTRQYEIFQKLTADLGMVEMSRGSFAERAGAARRYLGGDPVCKKRTPSVGVAASKFLESLFDENPKISETDAFNALQAQPLDGSSPLPSLEKVRHWLKHRRSTRRFSDNEVGIANERQKSEAQSGSSREPDDVDFWNELSKALAEDEINSSSHSGSSRIQNFGNDADLWKEVPSDLADDIGGSEVWSSSSSSSSLVPDCIYDVGLWKKIALAFEDEAAGDHILPGRDNSDDKGCPEGFAGSSVDQDSSRKRKRNE